MASDSVKVNDLLEIARRLEGFTNENCYVITEAGSENDYTIWNLNVQCVVQKETDTLPDSSTQIIEMSERLRGYGSVKYIYSLVKGEYIGWGQWSLTVERVERGN